MSWKYHAYTTNAIFGCWPSGTQAWQWKIIYQSRFSSWGSRLSMADLITRGYNDNFGVGPMSIYFGTNTFQLNSVQPLCRSIFKIGWLRTPFPVHGYTFYPFKSSGYLKKRWKSTSPSAGKHGPQQMSHWKVRYAQPFLTIIIHQHLFVVMDHMLPLWIIYLVGGIPTPLKNMKASWDFYSQYIEKWKMFQTTNQPLIFHYQRVNHH